MIQFEDGSIYREESKDMAERIRSGKLFEGKTQAPRRQPRAQPAAARPHSRIARR